MVSPALLAYVSEIVSLVSPEFPAHDAIRTDYPQTHVADPHACDASIPAARSAPASYLLSPNYRTARLATYQHHEIIPSSLL
jgi:hypothetical protein